MRFKAVVLASLFMLSALVASTPPSGYIVKYNVSAHLPMMFCPFISTSYDYCVGQLSVSNVIKECDLTPTCQGFSYFHGTAWLMPSTGPLTYDVGQMVWLKSSYEKNVDPYQLQPIPTNF